MYGRSRILKNGETLEKSLAIAIEMFNLRAFFCDKLAHSKIV